MGGDGKKTILSLEHEGDTVTDPGEIQNIIYKYYKQLFGKGQARTVHLAGGHGLRQADYHQKII